jgi:hypothetical protein
MTDSRSIHGSEDQPLYAEGPTEIIDDVQLRGQYFTYAHGDGLVGGYTSSVVFTVDALAREVWPVFKDFNLWQRDHFYTGVMGDSEGSQVRLTLASVARDHPGYVWPIYDVVKVIPDYLIELIQPVQPVYTGLPGRGEISPGAHMFSLHEHGGKTMVAIIMTHGSVMGDLTGPGAISVDEALAPWRDPGAAPEWHRKWRDDFIPTLKRLAGGIR